MATNLAEIPLILLKDKKIKAFFTIKDKVKENVSEVTTAIIEQLAEFQKNMKIEFLTESSYAISKATRHSNLSLGRKSARST